MKDQIVQHPNRYKLNQVPGEPDIYDFEPKPGVVSEIGTPINKATLLSDQTAAGLGLPGDPTPDDALARGSFYRLAINFDGFFSGKTFTVEDGDFAYSGTVPPGLVVTVAVPKPNTTYTVTCDGNARTIKTTDYFGIYSLTFGLNSPVFEENTWARIAAVAEAGNASSYWQVGDEKDIQLTTGEVLTLQIYGFNHDDKVGGGKAGITFGLKNLMADMRQMNSSGTNVNGFTGSAMYTWLQDDLYNSLPSDLKNLIKSVNKKTSAGNKSTTINTNAMKVFLFSEVECLGTTSISVAGEGSQYPIFTDDTSRIKKLENGAGAAYAWWERSPVPSSTSTFCGFRDNGTATTVSANLSRGVCFGFCL